MESSENTDETGGMGAQQATPVSRVPEMQEMASSSPEVSHQEGRRTQLKVVRERIDALSRDVLGLTKVHVANQKKLEAHLSNVHARSKEIIRKVESHDKSLAKQVTALRRDLAALRKDFAKEAANARTREKKMRQAASRIGHRKK